MKKQKIRRPRVYVAGPYSCHGRCKDVGVSLVAMREGIQTCMALIADGMAPFCPWLDFMFVLMDHEKKLPKGDWFYDYSDAFLLACDVMYVHKIRKGSIGVVNEMILADKNKIPVIKNYTKLLKWRDQWIQEQVQVS